MVRNRRRNSQTTRNITIKLLDGTIRIIETQTTSTVRQIFDAICQHLGITDTSLFGIAVKDDISDEFVFKNLDQKVCKIAPKFWKSKEPTENEAEFSVYLRVKLYVSQMSQISDDKAKYFYYQQLRQNFVNYPILYPDDRCFLLASYTVLAATGNEDIDYRDIFPAWVMSKHGKRFITNHLPSLAGQLSYLTIDRAEKLYVDELSCHSPIGYNQHIVSVKTQLLHQTSSPNRKQKDHQTVYLGIGYKTLDVYELTPDLFLRRYSTYQNSQIEFIKTNKRNLEVTLDHGETLSFIAGSEELAQNFHNLITDSCHSQPVATSDSQSNLLVNTPLSERPGFRESYIYSDEADLEWEQRQSNISSMLSLTHHPRASGEVLNKKDRRNRFSIVSTASSTTSGIVSDKPCLSYYSSQEDLLNESQVTSMGSRDSLLEPSQSSKSAVTIQRATSEPGKKFEQLKIKRQILPRAISNESSVSNDGKDPIYENIIAIRSRLLAAAQAKPHKLSARVSLENNFTALSTPVPHHAYSQGALNHIGSYSHLNKLQQRNFSSQHNVAMKSSPSMETLLNERIPPPPSYNEHHKRVAQRLFMKRDTGPVYGGAPRKTTISTDQPTKYFERVGYKERQSQNICQCKTTSHPDIDKLRDDSTMNNLPLIKALCNDNDLKPSCSSCMHNQLNNNNVPPRPLSWHHETFTVPTTATASSNC